MTKYVQLDSGDVGVLLRTDSRTQNGMYCIHIKGMREPTNWNHFNEITKEQYDTHKPEPVADTKPKRGAKKS